jgi:four helix bundle protein
MSGQSDELKERTMTFAVSLLRLIGRLPRELAADIGGRQLAKSATSVASNYRAACIARSRAEFIAKLGLVLEESDECVYWLELMCRMQLLPADTPALRREAEEIRAIFGKSVRTARENHRTPQIAANNPRTR